MHLIKRALVLALLVLLSSVALTGAAAPAGDGSAIASPHAKCRVADGEQAFDARAAFIRSSGGADTVRREARQDVGRPWHEDTGLEAFLRCGTGEGDGSTTATAGLGTS